MGSKQKINRFNSGGIDSLVADLQELILAARKAAARSIHKIQVVTNFEIGRRIIEHEQQGSARAEYGRQVLKTLSKKLTAKFGQGFSETNLKLMRQFYLIYQGRMSQTASAPLSVHANRQTRSDQSSKFQMLPRKDAHIHAKAYRLCRLM